MSSWSDAVVASAPDHWWKFAEASGTTVVDSVGGKNGIYGNPTQLTLGAPSAIPGDDGTSIETNGSGTPATITNLVLPIRSTTRAVTVRSATDKTLEYFWSSFNDLLELSATSRSRINFQYQALGYNATAPGGALDGGTHFVVWSVSATHSTLWVDGVQVANVAHGQTTAVNLNRIHPIQGVDGAFSIDDLVVWKRNLAASEVADLWAAWQDGDVSPSPVPAEVQLVGALPSISGTFQLESFDPAELAMDGALPALAGEFQLDLQVPLQPAEVVLEGALPTLAGTFQLSDQEGTPTTADVQLVGVLPSLEGAFALEVEILPAEVGITASLPPLTAVVQLVVTHPPRQVDFVGQLPSISGSIFVRGRDDEVVRRWVLREVGTGVEWTMPINPDAMSSPHKSRTTSRGLGMAGDGRSRSFVRGVPTRDWEFGGVIRSQEHYEQLEAWAKRGLIDVTDHVGRTWRVHFTDFTPTDRQPTARVTWRLRYTMKAQILRQIA